ncbi:unnamed protein product [Soboliphyme baturini]|uniref:Cadherin domain-containing protein n=1 Tax=Soboliphyme baturini TaxID=241478 RepID=A0A183IBM2_9BILA|nr:unnamed protein product [Soboliphyme baturini]
MYPANLFAGPFGFTCYENGSCFPVGLQFRSIPVADFGVAYGCSKTLLPAYSAVNIVKDAEASSSKSSSFSIDSLLNHLTAKPVETYSYDNLRPPASIQLTVHDSGNAHADDATISRCITLYSYRQGKQVSIFVSNVDGRS